MRTLAILCIAILGLVNVGCARWNKFWTEPRCESIDDIPNPLPVPLCDPCLVMDQISDELDDYFRIAREQRIRVVESILTEGWIETHPRIGSTLGEPWHHDSQPGFEKLHSTLQTIRRFAKVRVVPSQDQYWIDVKVYKELEELPQPVGSSVRGQVLRHDNSISQEEELWVEPANRGWIPLGRDLALEQVLLDHIQQRIEQACGLAH
jgi:hypothetical protein